MAIPRWVAQVNKRVFNKIELNKGVRPVLRHVGRSSGTVYRTPLETYRLNGSYLFILMYGSDSDWVRNVTVAGSATLTIAGEDIELVSPRLVPKDVAEQELPATVKRPPKFLNVTEFLKMDVASNAAS